MMKRSWIRQLFARRALHPAQLLHSALQQDRNSTAEQLEDEVEQFAPNLTRMRRLALPVAVGVAAGVALLWALTARKAT